MRRVLYGILVMIVMVFVLFGCSSSSSNGNSNNITGGGEAQKGIADILASQGIELVDSVTCRDATTGRDYTGYLGVYKGKTSNGCYWGYAKPKSDDADPTDPQQWECKKKVQDKDGNWVEVDAWVKDVPKHCLVLTGTPYSMGFQEGYLRPEGTRNMTTKFLKEALFAQFGLLGISIDPSGPLTDGLFSWFYENIEKMVNKEKERTEKAVEENRIDTSTIPPYVLDEIEGVTDGANAAFREMGKTDRVSYNDVFAVSEGIDGLFCFVAKFIFNFTLDPETLRQIGDLLRILIANGAKTYKNGNFGTEEIQVTPDNRVIFPKMQAFPFLKLGCNGFMVTGNATVGDKTFHGRDFMFSTGGVFQDESCVMVFLPETAYGYPFATVAAPGFVGQTVGLNSQGLSVGVDISLSGAFATEPGVGCLIIMRELLQHCANIDQAVERVRQFKRGMPWNYVVAAEEGSAQYGNAVVLEAGMSEPAFKGYDLLPITQQLELLPQILKLSPFSDTAEEQNVDDLYADNTIKNGVMVRGATWQFPAEFKVDIPADKLPDVADRESYMKWYGVGGGSDGKSYTFADQYEDDPDILVVTNHYSIPRMRMTQFESIVQYGYTRGAMPDSVWRYEYCLELIKDNYGTIDFFGDGDFPVAGSAGWIIDFLNPNAMHGCTKAPIGYQHYYYKPLFRDVDGLHAIMNNTDKVLMGLFGYLPDPWVGMKLMPLVEWYYGKKA